jgi:hypothetical protein
MDLVQTIFPRGRARHTLQLNVHLDNCRVHFLKVTELVFAENPPLHISHSPYHPELVPPQFLSFGWIKARLAGRVFAEPEELLECVRGFLEGVPAHQLAVILES